MDPLTSLRLLAWFDGITDTMPEVRFKPNVQVQQEIRAFLDVEAPGWRRQQAAEMAAKRARDAVERVEKQQTKSTKVNRV